MEIEIGKNLLESIKVIDQSIRDIGGSAIGNEIKTAFGIDIEKMMQKEKIIEVIKNLHTLVRNADTESLSTLEVELDHYRMMLKEC